MDRHVFINAFTLMLLISFNAHAQTKAPVLPKAPSTSANTVVPVTAATAAILNPCDSEQDGLTPNSNSQNNTISTALGSLQISVDGSGQSMIEKPEVVDYTTNLYQILNNGKDPANKQVTADYTTASNLMNQITGVAPTSPTLPIVGTPAKPSTAIKGGPVPIVPVNTAPTNYQELGDLLTKNNGISQNAKYFLLSLVVGKLGDQWNQDKYRGATLAQTLTQEFTALQNPNADAGLCGPIHTMAAFVALKMGLGNVGMIGTDVKFKGGQGAGHAIAYFKDPKTGKYVFVNYNDISQVEGTSLSVAALEQARNMSGYTSSVDVETNSINGQTPNCDPKTTNCLKTNEHLMQPQLAKNLTGAILKTTDPGQPNISIQAGNLQNDVTYQHKIVGTATNNLTAFGVAQENNQQPGDTVIDGAAGVGVVLQKTTVINPAVSVTGKVNFKVGAYDVHDQAPTGDAITSAPGRNSDGYIGVTQDQVVVNVDKGKNQLAVGAQLDMSEATYGLVKPSNMEAGAPYDRLRVSVVDAPTPNLSIHANSDSFLYTKSFSDQTIVLHPMEQNVGVTYQKTVDHGNVTVKEGADGYVFGSVTSNAYGLRDETSVDVKTKGGLTLTGYGEVAGDLNHPRDDYNSHPTNADVGVNVDKDTKYVDINGGYEYSTTDKIAPDMSEGALSPTLADNDAQNTFHLNLSFHKKK